MKLDFLEDKRVTVGIRGPSNNIKSDCNILPKTYCYCNKFRVEEHIKSAIAKFPKDIIRNAAMPAAKYIFKTSDED